jgi:hypothetical protein
LTLIPTATGTLAPTPSGCTEPANDTLNGACGPMVPGLTYEGYLSRAGDLDWYFLDLPAPRAIAVHLTHVPPSCDADLELRDGSGDLLLASSHPGTIDEVITSSRLPAGRYHIVVTQRVGHGTSSTYSLRYHHMAASVHLPLILH